jgi:signal transduction histidine kinase
MVHDVDLIFERVDASLYITIDRLQVRQVVINVLKNALESLQQRGTIWVEAAYGTDEWVSISITDTGPGISMTILNKVGYPFFTTKEKGIGLGLAVSRRIIEAHQGTMEIESSDHGTKVMIRLPAV